MIAWSDSVIPTWVRIQDHSTPDHPDAVTIILPAGAITAPRYTRHLGVAYTGQPCGIEIECHDIDTASQILRNLTNQLDRIRWDSRRNARIARLQAALDEAEADRRVCGELEQLPPAPIVHPDHGGFET